MVSAISVVLIALPLYWVYSTLNGYRKNIAKAKRSGLPYVITPVNLLGQWWLITHRLWLPLLEKLPTAWTENWLIYLTPDWTWNHGFDPFKKIGSDTFITLSATSFIIWVTNAEALHQITQQRDRFPKALESYGVLNIYGRNIVTTEGMDWKHHRKVSAPGFNEKNNALVFKEAIAQTQGMIRRWTKPGVTSLTEVAEDSMRVALHIIGRVGFGVAMYWPGEEPTEEERRAGAASGATFQSNEPPPGHTLSFTHALEYLLENLVWVLVTPEWLLKLLPFASAKLAHEAFVNWGQFMNEIMQQKIIETQKGERSEGMDLMGALVKSAYGNGLSKAGKGLAAKTVMTDSEILGNAFVMILAGHETTANSIHFALLELAMNASSQRKLQKEIEVLFGDTPAEQWDYDSSISSLLGGMAGAVLNEELRLMPPVINIPKSVKKDEDQPLVINGQKVIFPKGAYIAMNVVGVQRNPRYWPSRGPSKIDGRSDDLHDFVPERWLVKEEASKTSSAVAAQADSEEEDYGGFTGQDTAAQLFRPQRCAFMPFSEGARSCLGRRLAQVEVMAVYAVVFQHHSVELAVDEWTTDEEVAQMSAQEKKTLYKKAETRARKLIKTSTSRITLKLHAGDGIIPIRICKKGEERFLHLLD